MKLIHSLFLVPLLSGGCKPESQTDIVVEEPVELDYSILEKRQINWDEILSKSSSRYIVYFYSEYCAYCKQVKQDVLSYYLMDIDNMYFVNTVSQKATYKSNDGLLIGTKDIKDFYIFGTPFLVEITDYTVTNWYAGVDSIRLYISTRVDNKK